MSDRKPGWWPLLRLLLMFAAWACMLVWATNRPAAPRYVLLIGLGILWLVVWIDGYPKRDSR